MIVDVLLCFFTLQWAVFMLWYIIVGSVFILLLYILVVAFPMLNIYCQPLIAHINHQTKPTNQNVFNFYIKFSGHIFIILTIVTTNWIQESFRFSLWNSEYILFQHTVHEKRIGKTYRNMLQYRYSWETQLDIWDAGIYTSSILRHVHNSWISQEYRYCSILRYVFPVLFSCTVYWNGIYSLLQSENLKLSYIHLAVTIVKIIKICPLIFNVKNQKHPD